MRRTMNEKTTEDTLKDVFKVVILKYKLFLIGFVFFAVGTMVVSHYIPMKYTSVARFERRSDSAMENISKNNRNESFEVMKLTLEEELCGEKAVDAIVEKLGLTRDLPRDEKGNLTPEGLSMKTRLARSIQAGLRVEWQIRTPIMDQIALYCTYADQNLAVAVPNALIKQYQSDVEGQITRRVRESRDFLHTQVTQAEKEFARLTREKTKFESEYSTILFNSDEGMQQRVQETQVDIENLYRQKLLAQQKLDQVKALYKASKDLELKKQIKEIQNQIDQCLVINQMTESHPEVQKLRARVTQLKDRMNGDQKDGLLTDSEDPSSLENNLALQITAAQADVDQNTSEIRRLENRLEEYQAILVKSVPIRDEYLKFTKPLEEQQSQLSRWKNLLTEAQMTLTAEESKRRTQLSTITLAKKTTVPQFPPLWTIIGIALGGGLALGYTLAFIGNSMDHTIRIPQDAAREFHDFNVPVVGVVSEIVTPREKMVRQIRSGVLTLIVVLVTLASLGFSTYSAVTRLCHGEESRAWKNTFPQIVHYNESDLANRPIRIQ